VIGDEGDVVERQPPFDFAKGVSALEKGVASLTISRSRLTLRFYNRAFAQRRQCPTAPALNPALIGTFCSCVPVLGSFCVPVAVRRFSSVGAVIEVRSIAALRALSLRVDNACVKPTVDMLRREWRDIKTQSVNTDTANANKHSAPVLIKK